MSVLDRSELQESPLADLHVIADQIGLEGFRRLRKAELIDAILGEKTEADVSSDEGAVEKTEADVSSDEGAVEKAGADGSLNEGAVETTGRRSGARRSRLGRSRRGALPAKRRESQDEELEEPASEPAPASRGGRGRAEREAQAAPQRIAEGVVEVLGNGSAFLRVTPPEPSEEDVYISATQVRRCELVSSDRVSGPVRSPRRSERYPSLVRIDTINGEPADSVAGGPRYDDLPVAYPTERLAFDSEDSILKEIEQMVPLGRGSRAVIVGAARSGKTETLRRVFGALAGREGLELMIVLTGIRPEEIAEWQQGPLMPAATLSFAASPDAQGQAVEGVIEAAKRIASRGGHAVVLIDSLDGLHPHSSRKALAAARNLIDGGSLTVIATATRPFGGETAVIALDATYTSTGRFPVLDLTNSGTLKPELLVGDEGAEAIAQARAAATIPTRGL